ncbi:hypothetical protein LCGC14_2929430, partial [marine sediment metagenome]
GPAVKLNKVLQAINQMFGPYLQHIQQQGGVVRWDKLVEMYAKFANVPELAQVIDFSQPPIPQEQAGSEQPQANPAPKPSTANRGNARATRSNGDSEAQLMQSLMSGGTGLGGQE